MTLKEMSGEYFAGAQSCRTRIAELERQLEEQPMCEIDRLRLRRRICILRGMMRDTLAISRYLKNYYGDDEDAGEKIEFICTAGGVYGAQAVHKAC